MADALTQANRIVSITTPLGDDVLVLTKFSGREELSQLFEFKAETLSTTLDCDATSIVGKAVTVSITLADGTTLRYFNGYVRDFYALEPDYSESIRSYRLTIVPWLWFLSLGSNCQIFQQKSVTDIIDAVFSAAGFSDYEKQLTGTYSALDYCVQYRETNLDFVSRLMESFGIFYFFKHENGKHTLVLADDASKYVACTEGTASYFGDMTQTPLGALTHWEHGFQFVPGKFTQNDYNFTTPTTDLTASEPTVVTLSGVSSYELYDYPGGYGTTGDGTTLSKVRMQEREWEYEMIRGAGSYGSFSTGGKFEITDHPVDGEKSKSYALVAIEHELVEPVQYYSASIPGPRQSYRNRFVCIPATIVYRPRRRTPRPYIRGPQSALVVGSSGQEMLTDQYGRVKVQFYWDRVGQKDENSSCWIRVAQGLAGNTWGLQFLPRVGQEVLVEFLDGDPDRPIITGSVYNADQMPTYALPSLQNKSGLRTRSTTEGSDTTFSELTFDDTKGAEQVYFHAERDFLREVENNDTLNVGYDLKNPGDQTIKIYNNRTVTIENGNEVLDIQTGNRTVTVEKGNDTHEVQTGNRTVTIDKGNDALTISEGNLTVTITKGNETVAISAGNRSVTLDKGNDTLTLSAGNHSIEMSAGSSTISAMNGITLKCGENKIVISPSGITISGTTVSVEGQTQATVKGPMVTVNGSGTVEVKGGVIMLN